MQKKECEGSGTEGSRLRERQKTVPTQKRASSACSKIVQGLIWNAGGGKEKEEEKRRRKQNKKRNGTERARRKEGKSRRGREHLSSWAEASVAALAGPISSSSRFPCANGVRDGTFLRHCPCIVVRSYAVSFALTGPGQPWRAVDALRVDHMLPPWSPVLFFFCFLPFSLSSFPRPSSLVPRPTASSGVVSSLLFTFLTAFRHLRLRCGTRDWPIGR